MTTPTKAPAPSPIKVWRDQNRWRIAPKKRGVSSAENCGNCASVLHVVRSISGFAVPSVRCHHPSTPDDGMPTLESRCCNLWQPKES